MQAQAYLGRLQAASPSRPLTFVGVHVRRTDYPAWLETRYGGTRTPVDEKFFRAAMALARAAGPLDHAVRFLVISDDPAWCRDRFASVPDVVVFPTSEKVRREEIVEEEKGNSTTLLPL